MVVKALIVRKPYAGMAVDGVKTIECRSSNTHIRGAVGIIEAGTGMVIGEVTIYDTFKFTEDLKEELRSSHKVEDLKMLDKWCWGWCLKNAIRYDKPIEYKHPQGAVIWVNLK